MNEPICIPFSVYTAWRGYGWSSIPEDIPPAELDELYHAISARRPDFMGPGDSFEGVYFKNGLLAAFRMQSVPKWDSVGRDADYCAFAFMGYDVVQEFDFDALLALPEFIEPTHSPRNGVEYAGSASAPYSIPAAIDLHDKRESTRIDLHSVGDLLAKCGAYCDDWLLGRTRYRGEESAFAQTGVWAGEPEDWKGERTKKKASLHKFSMKDLEMILGGKA